MSFGAKNLSKLPSNCNFVEDECNQNNLNRDDGQENQKVDDIYLDENKVWYIRNNKVE